MLQHCTQDPELDYNILRQGQKEWNMVKKNFYDDFYVLTPWHDQNQTDKWTVYMFIKPSSEEGVIQAFRQENCVADSVVVKVKGICKDSYYDIEDIEGMNSASSVPGQDLLSGFKITLPEMRSSTLLFIKKVN